MKAIYSGTLALTAVTAVLLSRSAPAQGPRGGGPPPARHHTVTQSKGAPDLAAATEKTALEPRVSIRIQGASRVISANGIPGHKTGSFPNRGNPHRISPQGYEYRIPARPQAALQTVSALGQPFGIGVNGVVFDPGAAEWFQGTRSDLWQYEPLSGAIRLGLDEHHAHVQPSGAYHYHGMPAGLLDELNLRSRTHSPLVGWAADGFPIYALYGYSDAEKASSPVKKLTSSYRLKKGRRPAGAGQPGGHYDGTFVGDYEYVAGLGSLDECNGRYGVTPEFPEGTYAYFLTEQWPVIPRRYRGTPSKDFERRHRGPPGRHSRR